MNPVLVGSLVTASWYLFRRYSGLVSKSMSLSAMTGDAYVICAVALQLGAEHTKSYLLRGSTLKRTKWCKG